MADNLIPEMTAAHISLAEHAIKLEVVPRPPLASQGKLHPPIEPISSDFLDLLRLADDGCPNCQDVGNNKE